MGWTFGGVGRRILVYTDFISGMVRFGFVSSEMGMIMLTTWLPPKAVKCLGMSSVLFKV